MTDVWAVVVNWNGAALLRGCLSALTASTHPVHVLVVDNGSTDASAAEVAAFREVEWLPLPENRGFAAATNEGLRRALAAGARWVALVNSDVEVDPGWLGRLVEAGEARPEVGLVGGLLLFADDPTRVNSTGLVLDRFGRAHDRDFGAALAGVMTPDGPVAGVTGGAVLLRAEMLRKVGLFDPAFWAYYEDADLALRAAAGGFSSWYVSAARARHGYGKSFGKDSPARRFYLARNHLRFAARHLRPSRALAIAAGFTVLRGAVKAPSELLRGRPAHALAHLRGAGAGALAAAGTLLRRGRAGAVPRGAEPSLPSAP